MWDMLTESPIMLLFVLVAIGAYVGNLRVKGFSFGPAAVLFTALAFSAANPLLELPAEIGVLGLSLFAYTIGVACGPSFFASVRTGAASMASIVVVLSGIGVLAWGLGRLLHLDVGSVAGLYAGALTNTPALAAATERLGGATEPTVAYSITYLFGILGMITAVALVLRDGTHDPLPSDLEEPEPIVVGTARVTRRDLPTLAEIMRMRENELLFGRVGRAGTPLVLPATGDLVLEPGDLVSVIGHAADVDELVSWLGTRSDSNLSLDRNTVDFRRITVSKRRYAGQTVAELGLGRRFEAVATRLRRGDQDMLATADTVVEPGDRLRIVAPRDRMREVAQFLGDSETGMSDINPFGMALGLALGIGLGLVQFPMVGIGTIALGTAGGPLIVGLLVGRAQRTGPVVWSIPHAAGSSLNQFGLYAFLAWAGSHAGPAFFGAVASPVGMKIALAGFSVTVVTAVALATVCRRFFGLSGPQVAGMMAAAQTQPAVLAFVGERTQGDHRVHTGWALAYPAAMVTKIVVATALAGL